MLAARGRQVLALEPDPAMAAICRRLGDPDLIEVREIGFEAWSPDAATGLVLCAQAWHWLDPQLRWRRAAETLREGGAVAALWTFPVWDRIPLRAGLDRIYEQTVPEMTADFPLHPGSRAERIAGNWSEDVGKGFSDVRSGLHDWARTYTAQEYTEMIATHQDHIRLAPELRELLLDGVREAIEREGGSFEMAFRTTVCLARRAGT
jgi:hypothetical protein